MSRSLELFRMFAATLLVAGSLSAADKPVAAPAVGAAAKTSSYLQPQFGAAYTVSAAPAGVGCGTTAAPTAARTLAVAIPVAAESGVVLTVDALEVKTGDVAVGAVHDPALRDSFRAELRIPSGGTPEIVITLTCPILPPAVYTVTLEIAKKAEPPKAPPTKSAAANKASLPTAPQRLTLQLTVPAGELKPIAAQSIDRVVGCLFFCGPRADRLFVTEGTGRTMLTAVEARQSEPLTASDGTIFTGTINSTAPVSVRPGKVAEIPLTVQGDVPFGKSKTSLLVTANELATPTAVSYEVRKRFHSWLLLPAILAGLFFGAFLKVYLKGRIERDTARVAGYELAATLDKASRREPDAAFLGKIALLQSRLTKAMRGSDAAALSAGIKAIDADYAKALAELDTAVSAAAQAVEELKRIVAEAPRVPPKIGAVLTARADALAKAETLAQGRDAAAAKTATDAVRAGLATAIPDAVRLWQDDVALALREAKAMILPPTLAPDLTAALTSVAQQLDLVPTDRPDLLAMFDAIRAISRLAQHRISAQIFTPLADYAETMAGKINDRGGDASALNGAIAELRRALQNDPSDLAKTVHATRALLDVMRAAVTAASSQPAAEMTARLSEGKYDEALDAGQGAMMGGVAKPQASPMFLETLAFARDDASYRFMSPRSGASHDPIDIATARTWRQIAVARFAQSFALSLLLALAGLLALIPGFDGTWRGLLAAFFWGYASDISAEALATAAKPKP